MAARLGAVQFPGYLKASQRQVSFVQLDTVMMAQNANALVQTGLGKQGSGHHQELLKSGGCVGVLAREQALRQPPIAHVCIEV